LGVYEFSEEYAITFCMDFLICNFEFDIKMFKLRLWDTAGSEWFRSVTKEYYSDSCTAIIIYDITDENLFKSVKNWIDDCQSYANKNRILFQLGKIFI
jgi:GTPase SAR1 family protein